MNMTVKQRKFYIFCGVIVVAWFVIRVMSNAAQQAAFYRQQAARAAQQRAKAEADAKAKAKAKAEKDAAAAKAAGSATASLPPATVLTNLSNLTGTWKGQGALTGHGFCTLRLELREVHEKPGNYTGYSTLSCLSVSVLMTPKARNKASALKNRLSPAASVLTGEPENGSIRFHVDQTVNTDVNGCAATSFTATPFGTNRISVQWQEGSCQGGQILLGKAGR
jgi:hypothetical protein